MRPIAAALLTAAAAIALAACSGTDAQPSAEAHTEAPAEAATTTQAPARTPDPDAPTNAVFADSDAMAHTMCELWTTTLEDPSALREVADDVNWYAGQTDNDFMNSNVSGDDWGAEDPSGTDVICEWNGYTGQDGSPSDLLG